MIYVLEYPVMVVRDGSDVPNISPSLLEPFALSVGINLATINWRERALKYALYLSDIFVVSKGNLKDVPEGDPDPLENCIEIIKKINSPNPYDILKTLELAQRIREEYEAEVGLK